MPDWLFSLHQLTMGEHIEQTWGWDEEWQRRDFARRLGCCEVSIIESDGVRAGALWIERLDTLLYLTDLQILPAFQGRGIGSAIVKELIAEANRTGRTVELSVLRVNHTGQAALRAPGFHGDRRG